MSDSARTSGLITKLRSSFMTGDDTSSAGATVSPSSNSNDFPVDPMAVPTIAPSSQLPSALPTSLPPDLSPEEKLALFDQVLGEVEQEMNTAPDMSASQNILAASDLSAVPEVPTDTTVLTPPLVPPPPVPLADVPAVSVLSAAVPAAVQQATDTLNPAYPRPTSNKEVLDAAVAGQVTSSGEAVDQANTLEVGGGLHYVEQEPSPELSPEVEQYLHKVETHQDQAPQEIVIADGSAVQAPQKYIAQPVIVLPISPELEKDGQNQSVRLSIRWLVEWSRKIMKMFSGKVIYRDVV